VLQGARCTNLFSVVTRDTVTCSGQDDTSSGFPK